MDRKTVSLCLASLLTLVFSACLQIQSPQGDDAGNGFEIKVIKGGKEIEITCYKGNREEIHIPSRIQNLPVTSIGDHAFYGNQLTSVTIPPYVTYIGEMAFMRNELISVAIPPGVTSIGDWGFAENQLADVTIPKSVTSIGGAAFYENQLISVTIPSGVTYIGEMAFVGNPLTSVTIGANVTLEKGYYVSSVFDNGFDDFYQKSGRKKGTYVYNNENWSVQ